MNNPILTGQAIIGTWEKPDSKKVLNKLKLLHIGNTGKKKVILSYTKKDGNPRRWEVTKVIDIVSEDEEIKPVEMIIENEDDEYED